MKKTYKQRVLAFAPKSVCLKCDRPKGYLVWPDKPPGPRGAEYSAIGMGKSASKAWENTFFNFTTAYSRS